MSDTPEFDPPPYNPFKDKDDIRSPLPHWGAPDDDLFRLQVDEMLFDYKPDDIPHTILRRQQPRFRDTKIGKFVGVAVGLSVAGCASVPLSQYLNAPGVVASANAVAATPEEEADSARLEAAFAKLQAGDYRGTVVLDLGHGKYKGPQKDDAGNIERGPDGKPLIGIYDDPGAITIVGKKSIKEADIAEAMGARIAAQLIRRGYNVQFTRRIDLAENPHLSELTATERSILERLNSTRDVLANRFDERIETARAVTDGKPVMYLVLHADSSPNKERRGAGVSIHPRSSANSAAYRLSVALQIQYRDAEGGNLGSNAEKGIIPKQGGFGALFTPECTPEIGLGTRKVAIITPLPSGSGHAQVRNGLGTIPYSLIEMGNLSNKADTWRLRDQKWGSNFARATAEGVDSFFGREYEGVKAPPKPSKITVNGKEVFVVPTDPAAADKLSRDMAKAIPADKQSTTTLRSRTIQRCTPSGAKYNITIADYGIMKPQPDPKAEAQTTKAEPAKPEPSKKKAPDAARTPTDFAKRPEAPRTRS